MRENEKALRKLSGGTAHLCALEGALATTARLPAENNPQALKTRTYPPRRRRQR